MNAEGKQIWDALCKAGATEEDRAEAADQRAQADEEKAEAERNIADSDRLKEAVTPAEAVGIVNNLLIEKGNRAMTMSDDDPRDWSDDDIRHYFDSNPNLRMSQLSRMTGKSISQLKRILMPGRSASSILVANRFTKKAMDRYPSIRVPRGWRPPESEGCEEDYIDEWSSDFFKTCETFIKRVLVPAFKKRRWTVKEADCEHAYDWEKEGAECWIEISGKGGQKIGLGGRKHIVLDRNVSEEVSFNIFPKLEDMEFEGSEQFDVDEFADWTWMAECPIDEIGELGFEGAEFPATPSGVEKFMQAVDRYWIRSSGVRSKIKRKADMNGISKEGQAIRDALGFPKEAGRFNLGRVVQTRGVNSKSRENRAFGREVMDAFRKYQRGDWGDTQRDSVKRNNAVVKDGVEDQIFAVYNTSEGTIYIITEWDGSVTTILFANEY